MSTTTASFTETVLDPIRAIVGERGIITDPGTMQPFMESWRDGWVGRSPAVVLPDSTEALAAVVRICAETRTPIVPQGGNTGLTGASQPHADGSEIVISTNRLNRIREIDLDNDTMTVEAGCILANIQSAARDVGRLFPMSLAAEGSCQIGGNIATNAGGVQVVRYGNMRNLVAGLEVVLPDGRIWNGLRGLRKDNAGYDMKQIFIGSEGTLGIVTAAVLKLSPLPRATATALVAVSSPSDAVDLLTRAKGKVGDRIITFELIQRFCIDIARRHVPDVPDPLNDVYPWYVLVELADQDSGERLAGMLEGILEAAMEAGEVLDGVVAASKAQADSLWRIREGIPEGQKREGVSYKHDVSVPISKVALFLDRANAALERDFPGIRPFSFGHLGDGNIHYNPIQGEDGDPAEWKARLGAVNAIVHDIVVDLGGSISAEHGIGRLRIDELPRYKSPVELDMMAALKMAFDPHNIMNPGKILRPNESA
ncbi:FAD-binding oxidoreductase [Azospirillum doebereinerae]